MTTEAWLLLALIALGFLDTVFICVGWAVDHHITTTVRHRKGN